MQEDAPGFDLCYMRNVLAKAKSTELGREGGGQNEIFLLLCIMRCLLCDNYISGFMLVGSKQIYEYSVYFKIPCFAL